MQHTQGQWKTKFVNESDDVRTGYVYVERPENDSTKENPDICKVYAIGDDGRVGGEMEANARLIASAPLMLEALQSIKHWDCSNDRSFYTCDRELIEKAISQAMGIL